MATVQLLVVQGRPSGKRLLFPNGDYYIGRGAECQVRPDSEWVRGPNHLAGLSVRPFVEGLLLEAVRVRHGGETRGGTQEEGAGGRGGVGGRPGRRHGGDTFVKHGAFLVIAREVAGWAGRRRRLWE